MDWDDLRFFLGVARSGGLSDASRALRTSASTVSRRISALETALGTRLFTRHARGYLLTDEGQQILERLETVEEEISALQRRVEGRDQALSGTVRLATSITVANQLIVPKLPAFKERHPGITLEIATGIQNINLTRREADIALRFVQPAHGRLAVRRIGELAHGVYGSRDYVRAHCPDGTVEEIRKCAFVVWDEAYRDLPIARWLEKHFRQAGVALVTSDLTTQIAAARAGLGLAVLPCFCVAGDRELDCVVPPDQTFRRDIYLVTHDEVRDSARVRAVAGFLADTIRRAAPQLTGAGEG